MVLAKSLLFSKFVTQEAFLWEQHPDLLDEKYAFYFHVRVPAKLQISFDARIIQSRQIKILKQRLTKR